MPGRAEELVKAGQPAEGLKELEDEVRKQPADAKLRVFLFQLLCVLGKYERAMTQLNVAAELDAAMLLMAQVCRPALQCEALRAEIFAGRRAPVVLGAPPEWIGLLVQASQLLAAGNVAGAQELRQRALDAAPAVPGVVTHLDQEHPFEWIADADSRLGPVLEAIVEGRYFWVPFENIGEVQFEPPQDLRDLVWAPAQFTWANGGTAVGLIPTRYPGSADSSDPAIQLARKTEWIARGGDLFTGLGQRLLATPEGDYPILEVRRIHMNARSESSAEGSS